MSVNLMGYEQAAPLLNEVIKQATGESTLQTVDPSDFVSVAQTTLAMGYDKIHGAINQVLGRTIFSIRPYNRKFNDVELSNMEWGAWLRKIKIPDWEFQDSAEFDLTDGLSVDQWIVKKANPLQLNILGQNSYEQQMPSVYMDQMDQAFRGPEELVSFFSQIAQTGVNIREQKIETLARMLVSNFIAGKLAADNGVIHLLTEYNQETGETLTAQTVYAPDNFPNFIYWLYARLETLAGMMAERSRLFQINVAGKEINQHTEGQNLRVKMYAPLMNAIQARVKATTFQPSYLSMARHEAVMFWQSIETPNTINMIPTYLNEETGAVVTGSEAINNNSVIGVMYDRDALGMVRQNERMMQTPFNARGHYSNTFYTWLEKWYTDYTEKGVVLCLD